MMINTAADEILSNALKQKDTERARIADALIASLDAPPGRDIERAWQIEIDNRLREIDSGVVKCILWEEVRDRLYRNADV